MLDSNIVAGSLPAIARTFNASFTEIEWVLRAAALTAYAHGFAMVGLVAAGVASIACFLTYKLVRTSETAPKPVVGTETRPCLVPDCQTP
jgi:hypothetical protein